MGQQVAEFCDYSVPALTQRNPVVASPNDGLIWARLEHRAEEGNADHEPPRTTRAAGVTLLDTGPWGLEPEPEDE